MLNRKLDSIPDAGLKIENIAGRANASMFMTRLGIYYPRGASLGGSGQVNALNWAWAPDHDWDAIAELTGDESWRASKMRQHLINLENCTYVPEGTPGHGFEGVVQVSFAILGR